MALTAVLRGAKSFRMDSAALRHQLEACHDESFVWALNCRRRDRGEAEDVLQTLYPAIVRSLGYVPPGTGVRD